MRSAPTLKIWITPFASVAILEKLALLKIALCKAPALSNAFSRRTSVMPCAMTACVTGVGLLPVTDMADFRKTHLSIQRRNCPGWVDNKSLPTRLVGHKDRYRGKAG